MSEMEKLEELNRRTVQANELRDQIQRLKSHEKDLENLSGTVRLLSDHGVLLIPSEQCIPLLLIGLTYAIRQRQESLVEILEKVSLS